jgi:hypothetical protein
MNLRVTRGFLVVALVLGALVVGLDKFNIGPTAAANANATATTTASLQPQVFQFDDQHVTAFELHQGDKVVRIEKQGDSSTWKVAGTGDPANRSSFTSLIVRMSQLKATRGLDNPGTDLSQYGLDPPKESAVAQLDDGTTYELVLGSKTPSQNGTYAKKADAPNIYIVADQLSTDLERLLADPKEPPTPTALPAPATPTPGVGPQPEGTPTPAA